MIGRPKTNIHSEVVFKAVTQAQVLLCLPETLASHQTLYLPLVTKVCSLLYKICCHASMFLVMLLFVFRRAFLNFIFRTFIFSSKLNQNTTFLVTFVIIHQSESIGHSVLIQTVYISIMNSQSQSQLYLSLPIRRLKNRKK